MSKKPSSVNDPTEDEVFSSSIFVGSSPIPENDDLPISQSEMKDLGFYIYLETSGEGDGYQVEGVMISDFNNSGSISVWMRLIPQKNEAYSNPEELYNWFWDRTSAAIEWVKRHCLDGGEGIQINNIRRVDGPHRFAKEAERDLGYPTLIVQYELSWGNV
jgi:hypothetical protein